MGSIGGGAKRVAWSGRGAPGKGPRPGRPSPRAPWQGAPGGRVASSSWVLSAGALVGWSSCGKAMFYIVIVERRREVRAVSHAERQHAGLLQMALLAVAVLSRLLLSSHSFRAK